LYTWSVTGGTLSGDGKMVNWNLGSVAPGTYTATVTVNDGNGHMVPASAVVTVAECTNCKAPTVCPTVSVSCPADVTSDSPVTFTASVSDTGNTTATYNWTVSA